MSGVEKMVNESKDIASQIKELQIKLNRLLERNVGEPLLSDEVLTISKKLDSLIIEYYKADRQQRHSYTIEKDVGVACRRLRFYSPKTFI